MEIPGKILLVLPGTVGVVHIIKLIIVDDFKHLVEFK